MRAIQSLLDLINSWLKIQNQAIANHFFYISILCVGKCINTFCNLQKSIIPHTKFSNVAQHGCTNKP